MSKEAKPQRYIAKTNYRRITTSFTVTLLLMINLDYRGVLNGCQNKVAWLNLGQHKKPEGNNHEKGVGLNQMKIRICTRI